MDAIVKTQRVAALMASAEVWRIDEWRHRQFTLVSRAEAIRQLVEMGLKASDDREKASAIRQ